MIRKNTVVQLAKVATIHKLYNWGLHHKRGDINQPQLLYADAGNWASHWLLVWTIPVACAPFAPASSRVSVASPALTTVRADGA